MEVRLQYWGKLWDFAFKSSPPWAIIDLKEFYQNGLEGNRASNFQKKINTNYVTLLLALMKGLLCVRAAATFCKARTVSLCTREYRRTVSSGFPGCPTIHSCYFMEGTTGLKVALMSMEISREAKEPSWFKSEAKDCLIVSDRAKLYLTTRCQSIAKQGSQKSTDINFHA